MKTLHSPQDSANFDFTDTFRFLLNPFESFGSPVLIKDNNAGREAC